MKIISKANSKREIAQSFHDFSKIGAYFENFRVGRDRSLRKRFGFSKLLDLSVSPSAVYINGSDSMSSVHVLLGTYLSDVDLENLYESKPHAVSPPSQYYTSSAISFQGETVIFDGSHPSLIKSDGSAVPISAYVPLCANMWENDSRGEIFEELNCLSNHFRATYKLTGPPDTLYLPYGAERIDCVKCNGRIMPDDEYELSEDGTRIICYFSEDEGVITVYATVSDYFVESSPVSRCRLATSSDHESADVYVFGSSQEGNEGLVFCSSKAHASVDSYTKTLYGVNSELCFFIGSRFRLGSHKEIRALKCIGDDVLIFSEDECYRLKKGGEPTLLNSGLGASNNGSVTLCGQTPVCVCRNGIYRISLAEKSENTVFERIASCADLDVTSSFLESACVCYAPTENEVFIYSRYCDGVLVHSFESGVTSHFTGFHANIMFCFGTRTYFIDKNVLFVFSDTEHFDSTDNESKLPVRASFKSVSLDLGEPFTEKKCSGLSLYSTSQSEDLTVRLELDGVRGEELKFKSQAANTPCVVCRKLPRHNFYTLFVSISDESTGDLRVHALGLSADAQKSK